MERNTSNFIKRVIAAYGRALDKFLDRAWLTVPILIVCILGLWFFFTHLPFTLLPPGDSGFIRGVFIAQEGIVTGADAGVSSGGRIKNSRLIQPSGNFSPSLVSRRARHCRRG